MTPSKRKEFFNARLYLGNGRRRTWHRGPILAIGICCRTWRGTFPLGTLVVNITGSFTIGFIAAFTDPEESVSCVTADSSIFDDRCVRRLHNIFILQLTNTRSRTRWSLVQGRSKYTALICLLPDCRMAWTHSCLRNIAEIKTNYASS